MQLQQRGFIDGFWMKLLMAVLMVLDHLYYDLFPETLLWAHYAARIVAPMFVYLMCEGMVYTHDRRKYVRRMFAFGFGMLAGNLLLSALFHRTLSNSILLSLAISAAIIAVTDKLRQGRSSLVPWVLAATVLWAASLFTEGSYLIPVMALVFYYLRGRTFLMLGVYVVTFGGLYLVNYSLSGILDPQFYMILAVVPILCYNGRRGVDNAFSKYFFYVFYPAHIWVIFLIENLVK